MRSRGDAYLREVEPRDRPWLYRCAGFAAAGVALGAGTDAPFGEPDPWRAMQAAVDRRTAAGERSAPARRSRPSARSRSSSRRRTRPGGAPRRIAPGARADLCLLDRPWARARDALASDAVVATIGAGRLLWQRTGWSRSRDPRSSEEPASSSRPCSRIAPRSARASSGTTTTTSRQPADHGAPTACSGIWLSTDAPSQYFPLVYTTLRLEYALWGSDPFGYHLVNVLLHGANALLVWAVLRRLAVPGAWLAAALFALHPVQVEIGRLDHRAQERAIHVLLWCSRC